MTDAALQILLVDDDDVACESVVRALKQRCGNTKVTVARDGRDAPCVLRGLDESRPVGSPLMIVLDINMPGMNGHEFLDELRGDAQLHHHVVFALSSSQSADDMRAAYAKHVAGYIVKSARDRYHSRLVDVLRAYQDGVSMMH